MVDLGIYGMDPLEAHAAHLDSICVSDCYWHELPLPETVPQTVGGRPNEALHLTRFTDTA